VRRSVLVDLRLLIVLDAFLLVLATILTIGFAVVVKPRRRELVTWAVAYTQLLVGTVLFSLRGLIPSVFCIVIANMLILSFFALIVIGSDFFYNRRPRYIIAFISAVIALLWFSWFTFVMPLYTPRFVFYNIFVATISIIGAVAIAKDARSSLVVVSRIAASFLLCLALLHIIRLYFGFVDLPSDILDSGLWEAVIQTMAGFFTTVLSFTLLILHERRENDELSASARDRELLVREMAHRTKNDLAMVDSLISLEREALMKRKTEVLDIARVFERFDALRERIRCLAEAHDRLSRSNDPGRVYLDEYLKVIISALPAKPGVAIEHDLEAVEVPFSLAAPLGLAMNELVTNSLKHAFTEAAPGFIRVTLKSLVDHEGREQAVLEVRDNGRGLVWPPERPGLGTTIVEAFAQKLKGSLEYSYENGSVFRLSFEVPPIRK
jgi:two-component sensor histidine kinase